MAKDNNAFDGRESLATIANGKFETLTTGTVPKGSLLFVMEKGATSAFPNVGIGKPYIVTATAGVTLSEGDVVDVVDANKFIGNINAKDISYSKEQQDMTMDMHDKAVSVTDGLVATSGSVSGYLVTTTLVSDEDGNVVEAEQNAVNIIKSRFGEIININEEGKASTLEANTTEKDIMTIWWNVRNAKIGDMVEVEVIAVLLNQLSVSSPTKGPQTFNVSYVGNDEDEAGHRSAKVQVPFTPELMKAFFSDKK